MVQRLKELRRMHGDHHGYPDLIDDHLSERVLGNVCSVLECGQPYPFLTSKATSDSNDPGVMNHYELQDTL
jgi:hypothetical protein